MLNCPDCGSNVTRRIPRTALMRLLWIGQRILCRDCGERSLILFPKRARGGIGRPVVRVLQQDSQGG